MPHGYHYLLIHQAFVGPGEAGGTRHYELARHCAAAGHRFTIVASPVSYLSGRPTGAGEGEVAPGVAVKRTHTLPTLHRSFFWRILSFLSFMVSATATALRAGRVDLVMGTTPPLFQALSAWAVARLRRRLFLLEVRDLWPQFAVDMGLLTQPLLIALARRLEGFLYDRADHLLVNSPAYRDYLLARGVPPAKVSLIPNGVDPTMFDPADRGEGWRQWWGLGDRFVVTYAGALGPANDIPTLLRAAARLRARSDIHFLLVGDGKERPQLEAWAAAEGLTNVTFTGAVPKEQMPTVLAASDACVAILRDIPSFRTTYPNKVFDYMAAGRPTILAIDGVIRQVVETAGAGVCVPPGDDAALAAAVVQLAADRQAARAMGEAARRHVVAHFDRRDQAEAFCRLLAQLAERGR
ncbi:MAG: glycosyltransferase family 4 protein [Caldilineales bacterium]|nr:glycosyltransferase family 4 protein [Caldilineales bacterium]